MSHDHDHGMDLTTASDGNHGDHGDGSHGDGSHGGGGSHSMAMYFTISEHATILFKEWMTMTWAEMLGSCIAIMVLAILYEALKIGREVLHNRCAHSKSPLGSSSTSFEDVETTDKKKNNNNGTQYDISRILEPVHFLQTLLYFVQLWLSLCLMLVFMTFNLYLCLAVTVGGAIGYYLFAWISKSPPGREVMCH